MRPCRPISYVETIIISLLPTVFPRREKEWSQVEQERCWWSKWEWPSSDTRKKVSQPTWRPIHTSCTMPSIFTKSHNIPEMVKKWLVSNFEFSGICQYNTPYDFEQNWLSWHSKKFVPIFGHFNTLIRKKKTKGFLKKRKTWGMCLHSEPRSTI